MLNLVKIPRRTRAKPQPDQAVQLYYTLLDSHRVAAPRVEGSSSQFAGQNAAAMVAETFHVPINTVWRWIRSTQTEQFA